MNKFLSNRITIILTIISLSSCLFAGQDETSLDKSNECLTKRRRIKNIEGLEEESLAGIYESSLIDKNSNTESSHHSSQSSSLDISDDPLFHIFSYLSHQEVGRMQQVNRRFNKAFYDKEQYSLNLWKIYANKWLSLDLSKDALEVKTVDQAKLIKQIVSHLQSHLTRCLYELKSDFKKLHDIVVNKISNNGIAVGYARDGENDKRATAVMCKDGVTEALPLLNGGKSSEAKLISVDGRIIVGDAQDGANNNIYTTFVWENSIIRSLYLFNGRNYNRVKIHDISADGRVLVGEAHDSENCKNFTAVMCKDGVTVALPLLKGGGNSRAKLISGDGRIIVGEAEDGSEKNKITAVVWEDGVIKSLGLLNNGRRSNVQAVSADGKIIVGSAENGLDNNRDTAVIWEDGFIESLGLLNNGRRSNVQAVSADGKIIVGSAENSLNNNRDTAVIWEDGFIESLGLLNNGWFSNTKLISTDGQIIVGEAKDGLQRSQTPTIIWKNKVMFKLTEYLKDIKLKNSTGPINSLQLDKIKCMSPNANYFIITSSTFKKYYVAHIPHISNFFNFNIWKQ